MKRTLFEPEHVDFRESARRFVAEEITPFHLEWEREGLVARELFAKAAAKGLLAMQVRAGRRVVGVGGRQAGPAGGVELLLHVTQKFRISKNSKVALY